MGKSAVCISTKGANETPTGRPSLVCCGLPLVPPVGGYTVYATANLYYCASCGTYFDREGREVVSD